MFGRRLGLEPRVVRLHAIHVFHGMGRVAVGGIHARLGLQEVDIALKLLAHRRGNQRHLLQRLRVAVGREQRRRSAPSTHRRGRDWPCSTWL